ncbi:hypothetical protein GEMRC1_007653 [Eukaryota sp. GEM-RC1]
MPQLLSLDALTKLARQTDIPPVPPTSSQSSSHLSLTSSAASSQVSLHSKSASSLQHSFSARNTSQISSNSGSPAKLSAPHASTTSPAPSSQASLHQKATVPLRHSPGTKPPSQMTSNTARLVIPQANALTSSSVPSSQSSLHSKSSVSLHHSPSTKLPSQSPSKPESSFTLDLPKNPSLPSSRSSVLKNRPKIKARTIDTSSPTQPPNNTPDIKQALQSLKEPETFHPFVNQFLLNDSSSLEPTTPRSSIPRKAAPLAAYCRLKPTKSKNLLIEQPTDNSISIRVPKNSTDTTVNNTKELWSFPFTSILADDNLDVYKEIATPAVLGLFHNVSSTFFVFGGIASGKTYTLFGSPTCISQESIGLIPLSLHSIFRRLTDDQEVLLSVVELKDDEVYDLLQTSSDEHGKKSPRMLNSSIICSASSNPMVTSIPGLSQNKVSKLREALVMLSNANDLRRVERTKWNDVSTRSHVVLSIHLVSKIQQTHSKLCFVDLAAPIKVTDLPNNQSTFFKKICQNQSITFLFGRCLVCCNKSKETRSLQKLFINFSSSF